MSSAGSTFVDLLIDEYDFGGYALSRSEPDYEDLEQNEQLISWASDFSSPAASSPNSTFSISTSFSSSSGDPFGVDDDAVSTSNPDHDHTSLLEFIMAATWACIDQQHPGAKNVLYARFFKCYEDVEMIALAANIYFAPGLLDIVQSVKLPSVEFFKHLPTETNDRWAVYAITMAKDDCRPRLYVGVGTDDDNGVTSRLKYYEYHSSLPLHVRSSLLEGYSIVHKGLLC